MKVTYRKGNRKITANNSKELMAHKSWFQANGLIIDYWTLYGDMTDQEFAEEAGDIASNLAHKVVNKFLGLAQNVSMDLKHYEQDFKNETLQAVTLQVAIENRDKIKLTDHHMFTECVINQLMDYDTKTEYPDNNKIDKLIGRLT
jgi:hypothetical protein